MDCSVEYIKMCERAKEIQPSRCSESWQNGDFYTDDILKRPTTPVDYGVFEDSSDAPCEMYHPIWLPRQDQLQEMVDVRGIPEYYQKLKRVYMYAQSQASNWANNNFNEIKSMEQLWLAFVMFEKYNKIWTGEKWEVNHDQEKQD